MGGEHIPHKKFPSKVGEPKKLVLIYYSVASNSIEHYGTGKQKIAIIAIYSKQSSQRATFIAYLLSTLPHLVAELNSHQ